MQGLLLAEGFMLLLSTHGLLRRDLQAIQLWTKDLRFVLCTLDFRNTSMFHFSEPDSSAVVILTPTLFSYNSRLMV